LVSSRVLLRRSGSRVSSSSLLVVVLLVLEWEIIAAKMGRGSRYPHCSKKYPVPLFSGAWSGSGGENEESEGTTTGGEGVVILAGGGGNGRTGVPNCLLLAQYDFSTSVLSDAFHNFSTDDDPPYRLAVQPGGKGFVCSFQNDCRLFTLKKAADDDGETRIFSDERQIDVLQAVGEQNSLVFSADGTRLAAGGDDGHLRVVEWPSLKVILDQVDAHKSIKDLDFSLDAAFLASTSDDSGCRIWDLAKGTCVTSLPSVKGEGYGFARFSRDGTKPLMFVTTRKGSKGFVSAFDTSTWRKVKSKKLQEVPISAFAISRDGK
jgi:prolactin regulatory element-binding protein